MSGCRRFESLVASSSSTASGPERTSVSFGPFAQRHGVVSKTNLKLPLIQPSEHQTSECTITKGKKKFDVYDLKGVAECLG